MPNVLIILLIAVVAILSNSKKKKKGSGGQSVPGRQTVPGRQARPWPEAQRPGAAVEPVQPEMDMEAEPAVPEQPEEPEKPQVHVTLKTPEQEAKAKGFGQVASRECEHGVVGGSIAGDAHEGEEKHAVKRSPETHPVELEPLRPRINARELRRAVVMSEILKRPCERGRRI